MEFLAIYIIIQLTSSVLAGCKSGETPIGLSYESGGVAVQCKTLLCFEALPSEDDESACFEKLMGRCEMKQSVGQVELDGSKNLKMTCCTQNGLQRATVFQKSVVLADGESFVGETITREYERTYHEVLTDVQFDDETNKLRATITLMPCRLAPTEGFVHPAAGVGLSFGLSVGIGWAISEATGGAGACFSLSSSVITPSGPLSMDQLKPGHWVLTAGDSGVIWFEEVVYFLHRDSSAQMNFVHLQTNSNASLKATRDHVLYKVPCDFKPALFRVNDRSKMSLAGYLKPDDCVLRMVQGRLEVDRIVNIETILETGIFSPTTKSGVIMVDNVVASCYSAAADHYLFEKARATLELVTRFVTHFVSASSYEGKVGVPVMFQLAIDAIKHIYPF